jgi:hypothetical protein
MPFKKGNSGNPEGRPKGAGNKTSSQLRDLIIDFLENNFKKVVNDFDELKPKDRVKLYCDLLQYGLPRLQGVQLETEFDRLTNQQLDDLFNRLTSNDAIKKNTKYQERKDHVFK